MHLFIYFCNYKLAVEDLCVYKLVVKEFWLC